MLTLRRNMYFGVIVIIAFAMIGAVVTTNINDTTNRVFNGTKPKVGELPYVVCIVRGKFVVNKTYYGLCTGSLITLDTVLTVAHCLTTLIPENITVLAGATNCTDYYEYKKTQNVTTPSYKLAAGTQILVARYLKIHPKISEYIFVDVGIVKLAKNFQKTHSVNAIQYSTDELPDHANCILPGFGGYEEGKFGPLYYFKTSAVQKLMVACGAEDNLLSPYYYCIKVDKSSGCGGDSGAPLVCNNKVYALYATVDYEFAAKQNCGDPGYMSTFKLSAYGNIKTFLASHTKGDETNNQESRSCNIVPQCYIFIISIFYFCKEIKI